MLVFIGDLHLRDDPESTVPETMTAGFLKQDLIPLVQDARAEELIVVFLGDILDINRSRRWVGDVSDGHVPWSHWRTTLHDITGEARWLGEDFNAGRFENTVVQILDDIRDANQENYALWAALKDTNSELWRDCRFRPQVSLLYVPGNHDRLIQFSPAIRSKLRRDLGIYAPGSDLEAPFDWIASFDDYSAVALHGHFFDKNNFGGKDKHLSNPNASPWYDFPSLGDVVTVKFGAELVERFRQSPKVADNPELVNSLAEIDLVRPKTSVLNWLSEWALLQDSELRRELESIVVQLVDEFLRDEFVRWWLGLGGLSGFFRKLVFGLLHGIPRDLDAALKLFNKLSKGPRSLEEYHQKMIECVTGPGFADWMRTEHPDIRYIVSGHTHRPAVIPCFGRSGMDAREERMCFNTGTWYDVVEEGRVAGSGFTRRHQITHVTFYREGEDIRRDDANKRSYWEFWQGCLREGPTA